MNFDLDWGVMISSALTISGSILLLLILFLIIKPIGKKLITSLMNQVATKQKLSEGRKKTLSNLLINVYNYVLIFLFIVMLLGIFNIPITPLLAGAGIIGLAIGFGAQGLVSDIVTGFFILIEKQIDVDDYVTAGGENGIVEELGLRTTQIRSFDGTLNYIPNRYIQNVNNHTRGNMRALVDFGIAYEENIDHVTQVLQKVCEEMSENPLIKEGPDVVGVQSLDDSQVTLRVIAQTEKNEQFGIERELRKRIKEALDENNIEIPYPHQVNVPKS